MAIATDRRGEKTDTEDRHTNTNTNKRMRRGLLDMGRIKCEGKDRAGNAA